MDEQVAGQQVVGVVECQGRRLVRGGGVGVALGPERLGIQRVQAVVEAVVAEQRRAQRAGLELLVPVLLGQAGQAVVDHGRSSGMVGGRP